MRLTPLILLAGCLLLASAPAAAEDAMPWAESLPDAMNRAQQQGKLVLIHFWSTGCAPCQRMDSYVFSRQDVADAVAADFVPVKVDAMRVKSVAQQFGVTQWPTDVVATPSGKMIGRLVGQRDAMQYKTQLADLASRYRLLYQPQQLASGAPAEPSSQGNPFRQAQYTAPSGPGSYQDPRAQQWIENTASAGGERWGNQPYGQQGGVNAGPYGQQTQSHGQQYADSRSPAPSGTPSFTPPNYGPAPSGPPSYGQQSAGHRWNGAAPSTPGPNTTDHQGGAFQPSGQGGAWSNPAPSNMTQTPQQQPPSSNVINNPYQRNTTTPSVAQRPGNSGGRAPTQPAMNPAVPGMGSPMGSPMGNPSLGSAAPSTPPQQTPPANPPIVLDGYCPVTLMETQEKWAKGDPRYGAIHRGRTYLFAGPEEQQRFLSNPDYYSPVLSGFDPVHFAESGQTVEGNRKHGVFYNQQVYLFADESSLQRFWQSPQRYADVVHQAMRNAGGGQRR